jgi:hypothetical protein
MTANLEEPAPAKREPFASSANEDEQGERYGPLALARLRKEDGRRLLLFSHARGEQRAEAG